MIHITHYKTPVHLSNVAKVTRTKTENVTQALWNGEKVTSVSIKWPHKDSFDQELAVWRILVFRHHLMIQTASSLYTCILLKNIASNRGMRTMEQTRAERVNGNRKPTRLVLASGVKDGM